MIVEQTAKTLFSYFQDTHFVLGFWKSDTDYHVYSSLMNIITLHNHFTAIMLFCYK